MKSTALFCVVFLFSDAQAQPTWSAPERITRDSSSEHSVAITNSPYWANATADWMAFVRNGREICVKRTENGGTRCYYSIYCMPNDSAQFAHPSLAFARPPGSTELKVILVWESSEYPQSESNISYSVYEDSMWSQPMLLTNESAGDHNPHVSQNDSAVAAVWERHGKIMYSRFSTGAWSTPEFVSTANDTLNHNPRLIHTPATPIVVWQKRKSPDTTFAVMCSKKSGLSWVLPDTIVYEGDNRNPAFFKTWMASPSFSVAWSRSAGPFRQVVARSGFYNGDDLVLENIESLSQMQTQGVNSNPVANGHPIPIPSNNPTFIWHLVSAWQTRSALGGNGIGATTWAGSTYTLLGGPNSATYQNPDVSGGVVSYPYLRIWVVWEGQEGNLWKLYGSKTDFWLTSVDGLKNLPVDFGLFQNYPNPFNPSTTIGYRIKETGFVSIKVFDLLGREIATMVDEVKAPGSYSVLFDASNLSSGVYYCQLRARGYIATQKMIFIR
jgi:hypothetical protein